MKTPEVSAQTLQASCLELQFFCRISDSYYSKVSPEGQRTVFGKLTGTSPAQVNENRTDHVASEGDLC